MLPDPPKVTIMYAPLDLCGEEARIFESAMRELAEWLARKPIQVSGFVSPMPPLWRDAAVKALSEAETISEGVGRFEDLVMEGRDIGPATILGCTSRHELAQKAMAQHPYYRWGMNNSCLSLCYKCDNPYIIWHESLHAMDASDCYVSDALNDIACDCPGCLMQYAPSKETIGPWPWLCQTNQERVRKFASRRSQRET